MNNDILSVIKLPLNESSSNENSNYHFYQQPYQSINTHPTAPFKALDSRAIDHKPSENALPSLDQNQDTKELILNEFEIKQGKNKNCRSRKIIDYNKAIDEIRKIQISYFVTVFVLIIAISFIIPGVIIFDSDKSWNSEPHLIIDLFEYSSYLSTLTGIFIMLSIIST